MSPEKGGKEKRGRLSPPLPPTPRWFYKAQQGTSARFLGTVCEWQNCPAAGWVCR